MKITTLAGVTAATLVASSGVVLAEGSNTYSGYYGSFDHLSDPKGSGHQLTFGLDREYDFGNVVVFGGLSHTEFGGDFPDFGFSLINIGAGYKI
ncbi:hypothetical protein [Marivivens marinus]|uniref:hypothetical protein n=1 Tax=Marivivens marinus TaxID=3110173 RepID=UPI003B846DC8